MTQPPSPSWPEGAWFYVPIIRDPDVSAKLDAIITHQEEIMVLVKVEGDDLVKLDADLDAVFESLSAKIAALDVPSGDLQPVLDDLAQLQGLVAPPVVEEPPA